MRNDELTSEQAAEFERRFLAAWNDPAEWRRCQRLNRRRNLPRRTRMRLAVGRLSTSAGIWLMDHVSVTAAERFWRITGQL